MRDSPDEAAIRVPADAGLTTDITYFRRPCRVVCDRKCTKAWGINSRPTVPLSDDPDDFAFLADVEIEGVFVPLIHDENGEGPDIPSGGDTARGTGRCPA